MDFLFFINKNPDIGKNNPISEFSVNFSNQIALQWTESQIKLSTRNFLFTVH